MRVQTITMGYWNYAYFTNGVASKGTMAGMMDRTTAERHIRQQSFIPAGTVVEMVHHTYTIPAEDVS